MVVRVMLAVLASVGVVFANLAPAQAALTAAEQVCQGKVGKSGRTYVKTRVKALSACYDAINAGDLPTGTDCTLEAKAADKLAKAESKLSDKITGSCPDAVVATLDFGGLCAGVTTAGDLVDCQVEEHIAAAAAILTAAYDDGRRLCLGGANAGLACTVPADCPMSSCVLDRSIGACVGGANDGLPCRETADCPSGACTLSDAQQDCATALSKQLGKLAAKRQGLAQKCKKSVAKGKLPLTTDCIAAAQTQIDKAMAKTVASIQAACPDAVAATMKFGGACDLQTDDAALAACGTCTVNREADGLILTEYGSSARGGTAELKQISNVADCVGGPLSRCRLNDYIIRNDKIRVVIQNVQRNLFGIGQFGGQIIDGDIVRSSGPDRDSFEEWSVALNIESTAHYTSLTILNDGSNGGPAILRATGVDDLLDFLNPSSVVAAFGFPLPPSANDNNIPVTITTDYILEPGTNYVRVETTVQNVGGSPLNIFMGEYIAGSGQIEMFQPGYGFGEPLVGTRCPVANHQNLCNFTAYSGIDEADGVSYGYVHSSPGSSTFTTSGVHVPQLQVEVLLALAGLAAPPFTLQPNGNPGDLLTLTRYFVVGKGAISDVSDARNEIGCLATGTLSGTVTAGGNPAVRADIAVLGNPADGPGIAALTRNIVTQTQTDANGNYSLTLPPGNYNIVANLDGSPYESGLSTPTQHAVAITAFATTTQNVALPATGAIQVAVQDENSQPSPAKVSVVGFDPSPDPMNVQPLPFVGNQTTGLFGERIEDGLPYGISKVMFVGADGDSGVQTIEPGSYRVYTSRGTEFSLDSQPVTVTAGATQNVNATVERVVDSTGFITADFHVHSIDSPDAQVARHDRVGTMLAEGVDFFSSSDHDIRVDFQPTIDAMGVDDLVGTTPGQEATTFDYGHFNVWPVTVDANQVNGGAVDHGGAAPDGQDYPSAGNFALPPVDVIAAGHASAPGASNTVQINHIDWFFSVGSGTGGLAIDTGLTPPASASSAIVGPARRLDPSIPNYFTDTFDAMEIWIGDGRGQMFNAFLGQNAGDWFNLLNQGIVRAAVADSDTHNTITNVAGLPHNIVASPSDDPGDLSGLADTISANVNAGRNVGSNGPMVRVSANAVSTGETASLAVGDPLTIATTDGAVDITVDIQSPTWIEFDKVEYYVNSTTTRTMSNKETGNGPVSVKRYSITPDYVQNAPADFTVTTVPVAGTSSSRFEATTTLSLTGLTDDIWVVVMVKGTDGISRPLYPVMPNSLKTNTNTTLAQLTDGNLNEDGTTALAFTNPLFIDVDGGGWTAPGVQINP
jgi:hypothetical protein